jgi:hypothetical protein
MVQFVILDQLPKEQDGNDFFRNGQSTTNKDTRIKPSSNDFSKKTVLRELLIILSLLFKRKGIKERTHPAQYTSD